MKRFEDVLHQCLDELQDGVSTLDECLARHPEHAAQLEPLLRTAARIRKGGMIQPSPAFKARARARLTLHMQAHPRRVTHSIFSFRKLAAGLTALLLAFLVTGTVYAQEALPGDTLYSWKLASESAWRLVSPSSVRTDFVIANRRIEEINATVNDPNRRAQALEGYKAVKNRLESELDREILENILPQVEELDDYPDDILPTIVPPTATSSPSSSGNGNGNGNGNGKGNGNGNGNGNDKDPKPTRQPKIIPTIEVPPPVY
jgi:hypothetical protein